MDICRFIEKVNITDWQKFDYYYYFNYRCDSINSFAETVPPTLIALALVDEESDELLCMEVLERLGKSRTDFIANALIGSNVRFAIGNDHASSYYPVTREALPFIIEVAVGGNHIVARACAINTLIDLYYFCPDVCPDELSDELMKFVKEAIRNMVEEHRDNFLRLAIDDARTKSLISDLLDIIDESN